jgi:PAS domain S-box-containing protein
MLLNESDILKANILIVDDQAANLELLTQFLTEAGYARLTSTADPQAVVALNQQHHYDLILLDLNMPLMNGFEVMEALKADDPQGYLAVIVLTAEPAHKLQALKSGAKDFISKPFDLVEVKTRIRNMLEVRLLYKKLANHNQVLEQTVQERTAELNASEQRFRRLTELASDWYWEQNETGDFTQVSGPVQEMLGLRMTQFLGAANGGETSGWNEAQRIALQAKIAAREPFLDFAFSRLNDDGSEQHFRVSGEPMFDLSCRYVGYRGIGAEVIQRETTHVPSN